MRLSRKSEYALRALVAMGREPVGRVWQIADLSRSENIPVKFLEQILLTLRHGGLLASKRGAGGGYVLRCPPSEIILGEVIELLEGPIAPLPCAAAPDAGDCSCPDPARCEVRLFLSGVREQMDEALGRRTLEDMLAMGACRNALVFDI